MGNLMTGFARLDITAPMGATLSGYFHERYAEDVLDPLYASVVCFDDGEKRAVLVDLDVIGINQNFIKRIRTEVAKAIETEESGVFVECTHTHLAPIIANVYGRLDNHVYCESLIEKIVFACVMAKNDLAPTQMLYTRGRVEDVAFVRRYRMKDGTVRTNPGRRNPDIDHALGTPDESSSLLILKREGKPEIGIVNFQVHPDVIGGSKISADYPAFVRSTYEKLVENSRCIYVNGCQGDTNHIDVTLGDEDLYGGYKRAEYMGQKIAMSVVCNYPLAKPLSGDKVKFAEKWIKVPYNKGTAEQLPEAERISAILNETGSEDAASGARGMRSVEIVAEAMRIVRLKDYPEFKDLCITALSVGDMVFAGFPGEPFTDIGRDVKNASPFTLTMTACCANGYEGYYPMERAYDEGGYEVLTATYAKGCAEKIVEASLEIISEIK